MTIDLNNFIEQKAQATCFYIDGMLQRSIPFEEVSIFIWDTLEEWFHIKSDQHPISEQEQVLWHLFHLLERWPEAALRGNHFLRKQLGDGVNFLKAKGPMLLDVSGVRP